MSGARTPIRGGAEFAQGLLSQVNGIVEEAARTDEDGKWGLDAWTTMIHNLIDLQIRTSANVVQMAMAGPWWLRPEDHGHPVSEMIPVDRADYPRVPAIVGSFERVGHKGVTIPDRAITFVPAVLPAGAQGFQIELTDDNYVGANYTGKISLRPAGEATKRPRGTPIEVTVGL